MLNEVTIEKLSAMRLRGMATAFKDQISNPAVKNLSFDERFGMVIDSEWIKRKNNHLKQLLKKIVAIRIINL